MVVGTDQQEEGKERDIKKKGGSDEGREEEGVWKRERKSKSKLKKEGYSYRGAPQASNSGGYMNSLSFSCFFLSLSSLHPSFPLWVNSPFTVWSWGDQSGPCPLPFIFSPRLSSRLFFSCRRRARVILPPRLIFY